MESSTISRNMSLNLEDNDIYVITIHYAYFLLFDDVFVQSANRINYYYYYYYYNSLFGLSLGFFPANLEAVYAV